MAFTEYRRRRDFGRAPEAKDKAKDDWLLTKEKDDKARAGANGDAGGERTKRGRRRSIASSTRAAKRGKPPEPPIAELATLVAEPPEGDRWLHETKFDGYRILARLDDGRATLFSRNGKDWTHRFSRIARAVEGLPARRAVIDGEVVALDEGGRSSFQRLQRVMKAPGRERIAYIVFDLLHLDGRDLTSLGLEERKKLLDKLIPRGAAGDGAIHVSSHVVGRGRDVYRAACRRALEGIVSKLRDAPYRPGRGRDWLKVRCSKRQEFVVGGFTEPRGSRAEFGALLVGIHDGEGRRLKYAGKVGTGFETTLLHDLKERLERLHAKVSPFSDPPKGAEARGVHWVRPELVAEVSFTEWTDDGRLRHPSFLGLREDKGAADVRREAPDKGESPAKSHDVRTVRKAKVAPRARRAGSGKDSEVEVAGVRLSHPDRILFPELGLTKKQLAAYYERVADRMLPHVAGRPLVVLRCPQGRDSQCFYQRHFVEGVPDGLETVQIREESGKSAPYLMLHDVAGLISLVQIGVLEVHCWGADAHDLEKPDRLVFDLDPAPDVPWKAVVRAALSLRGALADLRLESFVKTTGGKGLHVVTPLVPGKTWDEVRAFARSVAERIAGEEPTAYTLVASKARRKGRTYIDTLRNARGATFVAPYSTRARAGAPVSAPVRWDELESIRSETFTIETVVRRLDRMRLDPWAGFETARPAQRRARVR